MSIYIHVQGNQGYSAAYSTAQKGQNDGVKMACNHFNNFDQKPPGVSVVDAAISRIIITSDLEEELSMNFQKVLQNIGQTACADEKLYHYTGQSGFIKQVLNKPARIGHWFINLQYHSRQDAYC